MDLKLKVKPKRKGQLSTGVSPSKPLEAGFQEPNEQLEFRKESGNLDCKRQNQIPDLLFQVKFKQLLPRAGSLSRAPHGSGVPTRTAPTKDKAVGSS